MAKYQRICSVDGCNKPHYVRGLCNAHYQRWRKHGDPQGGRPIVEKRPDLTGERFGHLVVLAPDGHNKHKKRTWLCRCDCGARSVVPTAHLKNGHSTSCGCWANRTHGKWKTPEHRVWGLMKQRCHNEKNSRYRRYGGRGIEVCERWRNDFAAFFEDMGPRPSPAHSIDRINNNGNYEPGNCRWATRETQGSNKSTNRIIELEGVRGSVVEVYRRLSPPVSYQLARKRLCAGWTPQDAFYHPRNAHR